MALTRDFTQTIQTRAARDPTFRRELLREGIQCLLAGDVDTGKTVLRDYINATVGFEELAHRSPAVRDVKPASGGGAGPPIACVCPCEAAGQAIRISARRPARETARCGLPGSF